MLHIGEVLCSARFESANDSRAQSALQQQQNGKTAKRQANCPSSKNQHNSNGADFEDTDEHAPIIEFMYSAPFSMVDCHHYDNLRLGSWYSIVTAT